MQISVAFSNPILLEYMRWIEGIRSISSSHQVEKVSKATNGLSDGSFGFNSALKVLFVNESREKENVTSDRILNFCHLSELVPN